MKTIAAILLCAALVSCASIAPPATKGSVDHVVLVWQKRPGNETDRQKLRDASQELRSIPGLRFLDHGTALASERPIVDDSFDLAFVMRFESADALQTYEKNPLHVRKVNETLKPLSRKILIYDILH
jgi:hypothetical protein